MTEREDQVNDTLTIDEVATMHRVSRRTVERWISRRKLTAHKLPGGLVRIKRTDAAGALTPVEEGAAASPAAAPDAS